MSAREPDDPVLLSAERLPASFAQFVTQIGGTVLVYLGEVQDPGKGVFREDLVAARHAINVLEMLREKTRGNLDDEESGLLDALIEELNAKYRRRRAAG